MLQSKTLAFLKALAKNNNKNWFDTNRTQYDNARADVEGLAEQILQLLAKQDGRFHEIRPRDVMFRINRDVRFSADKSPYKTNMGIYFSPAGKKSDMPGYYLHIEPGKAFIAAGTWMPEPQNLSSIRQEIDYNYEEINKILNKASFKKAFSSGLRTDEKLKRAPKGFDENTPAIELIKNKSFIVSAPISDTDLTDKNLLKKLQHYFTEAIPFIAFLERSFH